MADRDERPDMNINAGRQAGKTGIEPVPLQNFGAVPELRFGLAIGVGARSRFVSVRLLYQIMLRVSGWLVLWVPKTPPEPLTCGVRERCIKSCSAL